MAFVMVVTLYSLVLQAAGAARALRDSGLHFGTTTLDGGVSVVLLVLAAVLIVEAVKAVRAPLREVA